MSTSLTGNPLALRILSQIQNRQKFFLRQRPHCIELHLRIRQWLPFSVDLDERDPGQVGRVVVAKALSSHLLVQQGQSIQ